MNRMNRCGPRSFAFVVVLITTTAWRADTQTLADAAKKAGESSSAVKVPSRSFSDKDVKGSLAEDGVIPTSDANADGVAPPGPILSREEIVTRVMPAVVT